MRFSMFFIFAFFLSSFCAVNAQIRLDQDERQRDDLPKSIKEVIVKRRIEDAKKNFSEMLKRSEEAEELSKQLSVSYEQNKSLTAEDRRKLERLEKLIRKIRDDLGGEGDGEEEQQKQPLNLDESFELLKNSSEELASILKKSSQFTVSATAVELSGSILKAIKFIKYQLARNE
jgi:membrane-associated HD superfamily phosphohydrolase